MTTKWSPGKWIGKNAFFLVGILLMLASSGLDGEYLAQVMPVPILGYVLNLAADIADMAFAFKYQRLQRSRDETKRKAARMLIVGQAIATAYSWFFSWLQLRTVMTTVEPTDWMWISPIAGAFVPLLLIFCGIGQALEDTRASDLRQVSVRSEQLPTRGEQVSPIAEQLFTQDEHMSEQVSMPGGQVSPIVRLTDRQIAILAAIVDDPQVSNTQLSAQLGVARSTVARDLSSMSGMGVVARGANGDGWRPVR